MSGPPTPVRVIYAKLTSVGAWDVVARTANINEADALTLAERLLLGAPPHDAIIEEEVASLRNPDGGRIVLRFTPYAWRDPQGRRVFMSDIVWLNDIDFERVRCNPFAMLPRCEEVFDTLTELPAVELPSWTADDDHRRLQGMPRVDDAESMIAGAIPFDPVLIVDEKHRAEKAELFTLLLPPSARPLFSFQTRAFRVPDIVPRVTMTEAYFSSLHSGPWQAVLPDIARDIPVQLARSLVALREQPDVLRAAHEIYHSIAMPVPDLRVAVTRVVELSRLVTLFQQDAVAALHKAARRDTPDGPAVLRALIAQSPADVVTTATLALAANPADHAVAQRMVEQAAQVNENLGAAIALAVTQQLAAARLVPDTALGTSLVTLHARAHDAAAIADLLAIDVRETAGFVADPDATDNPVLAEFLTATRERGQSRHQLSSASRFLDALVDLGADVRARPAFATLGREAVRSAIAVIELDSRSVGFVRSLQRSADRLLEVDPSLPLPDIATDRQISSLSEAGAPEMAGRIRQKLPPETVAVLVCTLLLRATGEHAAARIALATALLANVPEDMRVRTRHILKELGVDDAQLVALPGADRVLAQFGGNVERIAMVQRIVAAARQFATSQDDAAAALAGAALLARRAGVMLNSADAAAVQSIGESLASASARFRETSAQDWTALELIIDMLAYVSDIDTFRTIQDTALGDRGMPVRLRRLAYAGAECRNAGDRYQSLAQAVESPQTPIDHQTRAQLRTDLNTRGLQGRLIDMISSVMNPHAGK